MSRCLSNHLLKAGTKFGDFTVADECRRRGYLLQTEYPFSNAKKGKVSIPAPASRKDEYLDIARMTELYQVFVNKNYPDTWKKGYAERAHYALGLFLVQYLGNGFNLVDVAQLTYWEPLMNVTSASVYRVKTPMFKTVLSKSAKMCFIGKCVPLEPGHDTPLPRI